MKLILSTLIVFIHTLLVLALPTKEGSDPNSAKKYLVSDLPGLHENITPDDSIPLMFAGQLEIYPETDTHYFFWKFSDLNPETRLLIELYFGLMVGLIVRLWMVHY